MLDLLSHGQNGHAHIAGQAALRLTFLQRAAQRLIQVAADLSENASELSSGDVVIAEKIQEFHQILVHAPQILLPRQQEAESLQKHHPGHAGQPRKEAGECGKDTEERGGQNQIQDKESGRPESGQAAP